MKRINKKKKYKKLLFLCFLLLLIAVGVALIFYGNRLPFSKTSTSIALDNPRSIPEFDGQDSVMLNNNKPCFSKEYVEEIEGEFFSELDYLGRCGMVVAKLHKSMMPTEPRGEIGQIKPTGWVQNKYPGIVDSNPPYLYNRCHLIAYSMTGQNANPRNLITGTRYFNVNVMLPVEKKILNYLDNSDKHVLYRVTPLFIGDELLARGVEVEALSVEDYGKSLMLHVFLYNYQPGIDIDYRTGNNCAD